MPLFRKRGAARDTAAQTAGPTTLGPPDTVSPLLNVFGRELAAVLDEDSRNQTFNALGDTSHITAADDTDRAFATLDWIIRVWLRRWVALVPGADEEFSRTLTGLPAVCDLDVAETAGHLVGALAQIPEKAELTIADYSGNFYEKAAASAARGAAAQACTASAGTAAVAAASSTILDACMAARTDVALASVKAIALLTSLDGVMPYIENWAAGPGEFDAKRISISNLAPHAARMALEPIVDPLRQSAVELYLSLTRPRTA